MWNERHDHCGGLAGCPDQWVQYGTERFCHRYGRMMMRESGMSLRLRECLVEFGELRPDEQVPDTPVK